MEIKVVGSGCDECSSLYDNVVAAVNEKGIDAELVKVDDLVEMVKMGIMTVPALVIDNKVVVSGRVPKKDEIKKLL